MVLLVPEDSWLCNIYYKNVSFLQIVFTTAVDNIIDQLISENVVLLTMLSL